MVSSRPVLLQPRWIVAHVIVLAVVVTFPLLGLWQLDRWDTETDRAERIEQGLAEAPVPVTSVLDGTITPDGAVELEYTPVTAAGTYVADEQVFHRNRDFAGTGGFDVLTPLDLGDGTAVLVRRGFVPPDTLSGAEPSDAPAPNGAVEVAGYLERSTTPPTGFSAAFSPSDPADGTLDTVFYSDVARIDQQTALDLRPMVLHLTDQDPPPGDGAPLPQPAPEVDTSQNLSYAGQWFAFTAIAVIGYAVVLYRKSRALM